MRLVELFARRFRRGACCIRHFACETHTYAATGTSASESDGGARARRRRTHCRAAGHARSRLGAAAAAHTLPPPAPPAHPSAATKALFADQRADFRQQRRNFGAGRRPLGTITVGSRRFTIRGRGCAPRGGRQAFAGVGAHISVGGRQIAWLSVDQPEWGTPNPLLTVYLADGRYYSGEYTFKRRVASAVILDTWADGALRQLKRTGALPYWEATMRSPCLR